MLGKLLDGRYKLIYKLGQGGFGETYVAQDIRVLNRQVVVKHLKPSNNDPNVLREAKLLFAQEAQILAKLGREHDQIPDLLAYIEENQEFYLVQEFIAGFPLSAEILASKRLTEPQVIEILEDVLGVLSYIHKNNVIHRDIKPSNLMRRQPDGKIVVIDFGAVKQLHTLVVNYHGKTTFSRVIGSPGYMPNEQQGGRPRFSSDIYALGITAIYALTGLSSEQLQEDPKTGEISWRQHAQVSKKLAGILDKMVRSHLQDRYQTADEVLKDIQKLRKPFIELMPIRLQFFKLWYVLALLVIIVTSLSILKIFASPQNAVTLVQQGNELVDYQKYEEANVTFDKAIKIQPNSSEAWHGKGRALLGLNQYQEALAAFNKAIQIEPKSFGAQYGQGQALFFLENYQEANVAFQEALKIKPNALEALYYQGQTLSKLKRYDAARIYFEKALDIKPNSVEFLVAQGDVLDKSERHEESLKFFDRAIAIKPDLDQGWVGRGKVLYEMQQYKKAIESFDRAIAIKHNLFEAWLIRGQAFSKLQQYQEGLESFNEALNIDPNSAEAWNFKGESLNELQKYQEALMAFEEALRIKPDFPEAQKNKTLASKQLDANNKIP